MRAFALRKVYALCLVIVFCGNTKADIIESFAVRDWALFAYNDDQTKQFSHCAMIASYQNGVSLMFSIDAGKNSFMGLYGQRWALIPGQTYAFTMKLDKAQSDPWFGVAASAETLRIPLADGAKVFERFGRAQNLTVNAPGGQFKFSLTNSRAALAAVVSCNARHLSGGYSTANFLERRPKVSPVNLGDEKLYGEAAIVMTNILSAIGSSGHRLMPIEIVKQKFQGDHAAWVGNGTAGTLRVYPRAPSAEELVADLTVASSKDCTGKFASAKTTAGPGAIKVAIICQKEKFISYQFVVLPRPRGGLYVHSVFAIAETSEAATFAVKYGDLILASSEK